MLQCMLSKLRFGGTVDSESVSPTAINTIKAWMNATATHVCFNYDKDGGPAPNGCLPLPLHDITTLVKGYPSLSNDFLFNRRLNDNLWSLVKEYGREKSILVICTSRNSAAEAALLLKGEATAAVHDLKIQGKVGLNEFSWHPGSVYWTDRPSVLVRDQSHWETLQRAALQIENLDLQRVIPHGIGFSHAGLSWGDRCLVKALFESGDLRIVCSTNGTSGTMPPTSFSHTSTHHTLLPAHTKSITKQLLLILKGTKRYVSNYRATQSAGYSEADGYAVINIIRDAVTNLFSIPDVPALAVIMTEQKVGRLNSRLQCNAIFLSLSWSASYFLSQFAERTPLPSPPPISKDQRRRRVVLDHQTKQSRSRPYPNRAFIPERMPLHRDLHWDGDR